LLVTDIIRNFTPMTSLLSDRAQAIS